MKIACNSNTPFGAKLIRDKVNVGRYGNDGRYHDFESNFVEIQPECDNDIEALKNAVKYWENDKFGMNACYVVQAAKNGSKYYVNHKVYALTAQQDKFEILNPDEILGVVHVVPLGGRSKELFVEHVQTNPNYLNIISPKYVGIGTAMINSLKELCNMMTLFSSKEKSVKHFYAKNGFCEYPPNTNAYTWIKDIFDRF